MPRLGARVVSAAELVENVGDERTHDGDGVGDAAARSGGVDNECPLAAPAGDADEATGEHRRGHRVFAATPRRVGQPVDSRGGDTPVPPVVRMKRAPSASAPRIAPRMASMSSGTTTRVASTP